MKSLVLLRAMAKFRWINISRYGFDLASNLFVVYLVFVLLFFGAKALVAPGPGSGNTLSSIVVGFLVWVLAIYVYSDVSFELTQEATAGTLEQLAMSPFGLTRVVVGKVVGGLLFNLATWFVLLLLMMATSGRWLNLDLVSLGPLVVLTLSGVLGIGFVLGGLALVFKRVQAALQIVQFLFVGLVALPLDQVPWFRFLPLAWGNDLIRRVMIDGTSIVAIPAGELGLFTAHAAVWLTVGVAAFSRLERAAKDRALLGQY